MHPKTMPIPHFHLSALNFQEKSERVGPLAKTALILVGSNIAVFPHV
jgi:hypothetical protein